LTPYNLFYRFSKKYQGRKQVTDHKTLHFGDNTYHSHSRPKVKESKQKPQPTMTREEDDVNNGGGRTTTAPTSSTITPIKSARVNLKLLCVY